MEVADILRAHQQVSGTLELLLSASRGALRAIRDCRTAALGGHMLQCDRCGHRAISYNSCLMGSNSLWGV